MPPLMIYRWVVSLVFPSMMLVALGGSWGGYPAMGPSLNPISGIWRNIPRKKPTKLSIEGLKDSVEIHWDDHQIPHIFAQNLEDLYFAQGYLLASERLFQMDSLTRAGLGRVSEMIGKPKAMVKDRFIISLGLREAARKKVKMLMDDPVTRKATLSYVAGVNSYIEQMDELPFEYKILGIRPQKWEPIRLVGILNIMGWRLAGFTRDLELTSLAKKYGFETVEKLFPTFPKKALPIARGFKSGRIIKESLQERFLSHFDNDVIYFGPEGGHGSNNWAVHPSHTINSKTLVANDTHLSYILPSSWYELQLHAPGVNVYGATLPGTVGIIIGMTEKVAWAVTNVRGDLLDWYEVEFKDEKSLEYKHNGVWKKAQVVREEMHIHGKGRIDIEQIWTHHGIVYKRQGSLGLVVKTTLHESSNEIRTFLDLNRSQNFEECQKSLVHFVAPALNFICADFENIGVWHNGFFPDKWMDQGRYVLDGRRLSHDWGKWLERKEIPFEVNPKRGYVLSANQLAVDRQANMYLGWDYIDSYRAFTIDNRLRETKKHSPRTMIDIQNDTRDLLTQEIKTVMIDNVDSGRIDDQQRKILRRIRKWDGNYGVGLFTPSIFRYWYENLIKMIWSDQLTVNNTVVYPFRNYTIDIIIKASQGDPWAVRWVDDISTKETENLVSLVTQAFLKTWGELEGKFGSRPDNWLWKNVRETKLPHVLNLTGFSEVVPVPGVETTIHSNKGYHGPSWKMVVEIGKDSVQSWANYPGGPSGNPFDPNYSRFVKSWAKGEMREVNFYKSLPTQSAHQLTIHPMGEGP